MLITFSGAARFHVNVVGHEVPGLQSCHCNPLNGECGKVNYCITYKYRPRYSSYSGSYQRVTARAETSCKYSHGTRVQSYYGRVYSSQKRYGYETVKISFNVECAESLRVSIDGSTSLISCKMENF